MKKYKVIDGNEACSRIAYLFTEVAAIYPITPSSPMVELMEEWSSSGKKNIFNDQVRVVEMQSEAGAAGMMHGSLQAGCLTTTFTSSQGLLLMIPNMYKMAGELLPGVIHVAARAISTHALSIFCDHQDVYATRMTGFAILASSSVKHAHDLTAVAHLSSIKGRIPFLHFFDGFRTSNELQKIEILDEEQIKKIIEMEYIDEFRNRSLQPKNKITRGTAQNDDIYFQNTEVRNKYYIELPNIVNSYMEQINKIANTNYAPFVYYGDSNATRVIVAMGSVNETIKETVDYMNNQGEKVGLIEVHLYRPFSKEYFLKIFPKSVNKIAVLDRTKEAGSLGEPLYLDVVSIFNNMSDKPLIIGGRYGLSSKDTNPSHIKAVFDFLSSNDNFTNFTVGIDDDVTNLSIPISKFNIDKKNTIELSIYGYGSDGMISAAKSIIKLIGQSDKYVQGYFQYDSRKSGGITKSHIRISNEPIKSTYYVSNPNYVICTKESYINKLDILSMIKENGTFILNSVYDEDKINSYLPDNVKKTLANKNIKMFIVNANELARRVGLDNKISTIMEMAIYQLTNIVDYDETKRIMIKDLRKRFGKKDESIILANEIAINEAKKHIKEVKVDSSWKNIEISKKIVNDDFFSVINRLEGNLLPTSAFLDKMDGTYVGGTTKGEKREISEHVPSFIKDNCIECNRCSFVCPHSVIRAFILDDEELNNAPDYIKNNVKKFIAPNVNNLSFIVVPSIMDCTGCGVCVNICPGIKNNKALIMKPIDEEKNLNVQKSFDYLITKTKDKRIIDENTVRGSQFKKAYFEFNGACGGCGQPAYIKLLTQLYGEHLVIANATGCSSIYSASIPSTAFTIPWASSLFEDNAEYGYGMVIANETIRHRIKQIMLNNMDKINEETKALFIKWIDNINNYLITKEVKDNLNDEEIPKELVELKDYIPSRSVWIIGGDGWAYDIGFGGLDHVISTNDNINILILDTEVYSNTGGQSSKSSKKGSISKFTSTGKKHSKKDLARMIMSYPNVYVASVSLGADMQHLIKVFNEAENYNGPSVIIAYAPCIAHGIKGGLSNSVKSEKLATECGYFPIFRFNPIEQKFYLDGKEPNFDLYEEFLNNETRYSMLKLVNPNKAKELLEANKEEAIRRYNYYKKLTE